MKCSIAEKNCFVKGSFHSKFLHIFNDRQILLCTVINQQVFLLEMYHENGYDASRSSCQKILGADEFTSTATVFTQPVNGHYKNFLSNRLLRHFT
jgi:hypothetical protein